MWAEIQHHLFVSAAKNPGISQCRHTGSDFDGTASSIVHNTIVEGPSVDVPHPASDGAVHQCSPEERENHSREHSAAFGGSAHDKSGCDGAELHLVERVQELRDEGRARRGDGEGVHKTEVVQVTDETVGCSRAEGQRVAPEIPLEDDDGEGHHCDPNQRKGGFSSGKTRI